MVKVYIYGSLGSYQREDPEAEIEVVSSSSIRVNNGVIELIDSDGIQQYFKDIFAITYKNDYYFDTPRQNANMYTNVESYHDEKPIAVEKVCEVSMQDGFAMLKNEYTQLINMNKLVALTITRE